MCGISGYFLNNHIERANGIIMDALIRPIRPRGPDDEGICLIDRRRHAFRSFRTDRTTALSLNLPHIDDNISSFTHDAALIHTRYSIIDLTAGGHQPFISRDGALIAVFNGEIYNYVELRDELTAKGVSFRTSSDTEVLVEGYGIWREDLWNKMNGFWAIALYDLENDQVILSRDRIGVAPLYYRETATGFFFASAIQSLINISPADIEIDTDVMTGFLQTGIKDHDNTTCYRQIRSLPSLTTVTFNGTWSRFEEGRKRKYWDFPADRLNEADLPFPEAAENFRDIFFNAVDIRLRADVKVAFELSGGLDSSSVVAAAAILKHNDISTYTVSIKDADEEPFARAMLDLYPVDYHVLNHIEGDFHNDYRAFAKLMEEPYDNPNAYSHHRMLQEMKSQGVSVVVTGAGGDEVLAGYEASFWPKAYEELKRKGNLWHAESYEFCRRFMTKTKAKETLLHYLLDFPRYLRRLLFSRENTPSKETPSTALAYQRKYRRLSFHEQALYHFRVALVPFYMRSSDHFTMSIPIEHRFPLLDYRLVELGLQMPITYLFRNGWTKYLLRKAMEPYLPKKICGVGRKWDLPSPTRNIFHSMKLYSHRRSILFQKLSSLVIAKTPTTIFSKTIP